MHVLELYYCNPDHPFGEAEKAEALRLAPLLAAGLSREELAHDLAVAESQFRALVEQLPAITYLIDPDGVGIYRSPQSASILGTPADHDWGLEDWERGVHPDDRDRVTRAFADHMAHGAPFDVEYRYVRPDGEEVWFHDRSLLLYDENGELRGAQGVMFDITGRRRAEEALRDSERRREEVLGEMLRAEAEARAHIAAELHDDTIQVMTAAQLAVERGLHAVEAGQPERMVEALVAARDTIRTAVERARRLTFELRPPLLEAQGLRAALVQLAEEVSREGGFQIDVAVPGTRFASAVEDLAYRTIQEALSNARKHAAPSRVEVALVPDVATLRGCVADDGCGFDVERALDRRQMRLHMGLDAMRERMHLAGGSLDISSHPGSGSRIEFRIPLPR
jgi:PAS domain S-box-containing protein